MPKFRKKPIVVEAEQWLPDGPCPKGLTVVATSAKSSDGSFWPAYGYVTTIHGERAIVHYGDWVIAESDGIHYYPCKPDIFAATYEPV